MKLRKSLVMGLIAEESQKTIKARKKLTERIDNVEKKLTKEALKIKAEEISRRIERHSTDRIVVKKDVNLFDKNANSADPSRIIQKMAEELVGKKQ